MEGTRPGEDRRCPCHRRKGARQILPTLSPVELLDLSRIYLTAAAGLDRSKRLDLVHAAAALYGTAVLTTSEMRLLGHLELLRYQL